MIIAWNVRGLNKRARHMEIKAHLHQFHMPCISLLETRVKENNASKIREVFGNKWSWVDKYSQHPNGRIWIMCLENNLQLTMEDFSDQHIHCKILQHDGRTICITVIYAQNQLQQRQDLWRNLKRTTLTIQDLWMVIGDFNNVLSTNDRIGGNKVKDSEYLDMTSMMKDSGMFAHDTRGQHFTWSNGVVYSRIDHALCNKQWLLQYPECEIEVLKAHISDHHPLKVEVKNQQNHSRVWEKLKKLLPKLKRIMYTTTAEVANIHMNREKLKQAEDILAGELTNPTYAANVKKWREQLI
ncbi:uncharacterized protein LOC131635665 [Vicia villosa]|uniref:uncharacterized protein LOC131635665 n=1 Tax=Vicia villosa TaxID=3911 RepID=UPI00273BC645|nr:uncharacterized protein LOC131635665 [Vicia villosa]